MESIDLEKIRRAGMFYLNKELAGELTGDLSFDVEMPLHMPENIVFRMMETLFAYKAAEEAVCYPQDWKEAFKERWLPPWLKKRYPVKYTKHDVWIMFPKLVSSDSVLRRFMDQENHFLTFAKPGEIKG